MEYLLRLKMRYGHGAIITPYQMEEMSPLSQKLAAELTNQLINGQLDLALSAYRELTSGFFDCDCNEILSTMIHLSQIVYERLAEKYPMLKDTLLEATKTFLSGIQQAEIAPDLEAQIKELFQIICTEVQRLKKIRISKAPRSSPKRLWSLSGNSIPIRLCV